ncbi:MAG: class I SAM-dependent methyltransferase [Balneolaceae bacterium]|nr:class I SAM-dependent methyltransferase [Balneolaceae bacterium]
MENLSLLIDLHKHAKRQGPGGDAETRKALQFCRVDPARPIKVADIGCGTGSSALLIANELNASVTAVDLLDPFLDILKIRAEETGLSGRITTLSCSMDHLPFEDEEFDILWSEGAIYIIGFERGVREWKQYLKPGGYLVVSEITWLTGTRPSELQKHWDHHYSEIDVASSKISVLENSGYSPAGYFTLPEYCWLDNYYNPMMKRFDAFLKRNGNSAEAKDIVESEVKEIELYKKYSEYVGYGFYIARKHS